MPRYVILKHETPPNYERPLHWDLMLEQGDALWTWALEEEPREGLTVAAWALADHRLEYLTFEGELTAGRGSVTRWDEGTYQRRQQSDGEITLQLEGKRLRCNVLLVRKSQLDQRWIARFSATE